MVTAGVATNQVLSDGKFSWSWLYASLGVAVLSLLYSEVWSAPPPAGADAGEDTAHGRRSVYLRQLRASVRDMETVGIATQGEFVFRMRQVYVDVSVVPQVLHAATREPYLGSVPGGGALGQRRTLASVLRDADRSEVSRILAVIGGPGSGKTTLARNTALELCEHSWWPWQRRRLPVLLYLRDHAAELLADETPALGAVAVSAGWLEGKVSARWLDRRLDRGGCVVLLDGLDEVADPAERGRVVAWVVRQVQRHPHNIYVVTSRPHGYESNPLPGAEALQVRRFTGEQIERFLRQWCFATESRARSGTGREVRAAADRNADDLLARLRERPALYDLAANPLLLTMTANVHRYRGQLPGSRAELYAEMCDVLLHRRSEARGLRDATGLTGPHKQHVVQHLALAMMKAKVRDWPARDVVRAIRRPLRQVPGHVDPDVFLEEARKSGLLIEREHGVYGFAHLTLQEYLAAAQLGTPRADTSVLIDNVSDPWWRETILLWSAANDATAVITACLGLGTVPALALAFDCADQARTVDPETRDRLDALLAPPAPGQSVDPTRQRLLAGIQATRILRETIQLDDTTALCARPVPNALYDLFVSEERAAGRHHPVPDHISRNNRRDRPVRHGDRVAVGMRIGDAERFVNWLNTVTGEDVYRLPTPEELRDPTAAMAADLTRYTIWAHDGTSTVLHQPPGVSWPYTYDISDRPLPLGIATVDREYITLYLRLLGLPAPQRDRARAWTRVLATALTRASELRGSAEFAALELPATLAVAFALARALDEARELAQDPDSGNAVAPDLARGLALTLDPDRALALTLGPDPHRARNLVQALALARALDLDLDEVFRNTYIRVINHDGHVYAQALVNTFVYALARALERSHRLDSDFSGHPDPDSGDALVQARGRALGLDLHQALDQARALDPELSQLLDRAFANTLSFDVAFDSGFEFAPVFALDLAIDVVHGSHAEAMKLALTAFRVLFATWEPEPTLRTETALLSILDGLLTRVVADPLPRARRSEDPAATVRRACELLHAVPPGAPGSLADQVRGLMDDTAEFVTAMRDRRTPSDHRAQSAARTALLAAIAGLRMTAQPPEGVIHALHLAWEDLTTLDHLTPGQPPPNQILLLTRIQP
ncbi:NACHT domain-containing protein [Streptomyces phyllanthi]|uniref:NACHT domain-containing protein n=1 Tax=Streptomyces phyllanthi TaxID=1803180 RepID=UPI001D156CD1|nr:NACHT domain-containing protein [Streptomyces phyllanthi]